MSKSCIRGQKDAIILHARPLSSGMQICHGWCLDTLKTTWVKLQLQLLSSSTNLQERVGIRKVHEHARPIKLPVTAQLSL